MTDDAMPSVRIVAVGPDHRDLFCALFDSAAARAGWQHHCQCHALHFEGSLDAWDARTPAQNQAASCERLASGRMQGVLALRGETPIGWCHAAPRSTLPRFHAAPAAPADDDSPEEIGAIVCFWVRPEDRRQGVARALLKAALSRLEEQGLRWVEVYPREDDQAHDGMFGPRRLYDDLGFREVTRTDTGWVLRRALGP